MIICYLELLFIIASIELYLLRTNLFLVSLIVASLVLKVLLYSQP